MTQNCCRKMFSFRDQYMMLASCWRIKSIHIGFVHVLFSRDFGSLAFRSLFLAKMIYYEIRIQNQFTMNSMQKKRLSKLFILQLTTSEKKMSFLCTNLVFWEMRLFWCECPMFILSYPYWFVKLFYKVNTLFYFLLPKESFNCSDAGELKNW